MAEIPTLAVPEVQPRAAPAGGFRVEAPPAAFGASVAGKGLEGTGAALGQGADAAYAYAKTFQDLNNKAFADTANGEFDAASRNLATTWMLNHPGAAGMQPDSSGKIPIDQFGTELGQLRSSISTKYNLSPIANSLYDEQSRRLMASVIGTASEYAKTQQHAFWVSSQKAQYEVTQNAMASHPTDFAALEADMASISSGVLHMQTLTGMSDEEAHLEVLTQGSKGLARNISDMGAKDPLAADNLLTQYKAKGWMAPADVDLLDRQLHGPMVQQIAAQAASQAFTTGAAGGDREKTLDAIMHAESGGRNVVNSKEAAGTPGFTASGYYQITDPTWKEFAPPDIASKYPRAIDAPFDVQKQVAEAIYDKTGTTRWAESQNVWGKTVGSPIQNIESNLPAIQQHAADLATQEAQAHGLNVAEVQAAANAHTEQQYSRAKYTYEQDQTATAGSILSTIDKGGADGEPISDMHTLLSMPGMQEAYARLTPAVQQQIDRQVFQNANAWTPVRGANAQQYLGMATTDPVGFTNLNLVDPSLDLRRGDRIGLMRKQAEVRAQMQKGGYTLVDSIMKTALNIPSIKVAIPVDLTAQQQYVGALTTELEAWASDPTHAGKQPTLQDYNAIAAKITTSAGGFLGMGTHPAYVDIAAQRATVPDEARARITDLFLSQGLRVPTEAQVEDTYRKYKQ